LNPPPACGRGGDPPPRRGCAPAPSGRFNCARPPPPPSGGGARGCARARPFGAFQLRATPAQPLAFSRRFLPPVLMRGGATPPRSHLPPGKY